MCYLSRPLSFYPVDGWTSYKFVVKNILLSFTLQPWATSQVGCARLLFLTYRKCVRGCLVFCCDSQVHIDYSDASDEEEEQQDHEQEESSEENLSTFRETVLWTGPSFGFGWCRKVISSCASLWTKTITSNQSNSLVTATTWLHPS